MDQPWNPAVLEQCIGRVHRLRQKQPVQVLHFVARDSIEHGMLDLIKFKRSLFAGVLDGSQDEVFMGGTRLKKFVDSVETATTAIPTGQSPDASVVIPEEPINLPVTQPAPQVPTTAPVSSDVYGQLFSTVIGLGKSLLENLSAAAAAGPTAPRISGDGNGSWKVETDHETGKPCLKIPMPSAEMLGQANVWLQALAGMVGKSHAPAKVE